MKLMRIPKIQDTIILSASECQNLIRRKQFRTPDKVKHQIAVPGKTIIPSFDIGTISDKGAISCTGQTIKEPNGEIVERALQLSQYTIVIRKEEYELRGSQIDVTTAHLQLPGSCKVNTGYCSTTDSAYLWDLPKTRCKLEKVRDVEFQAEQGYLVDHSTKILLKMTGQQPSPEKCPIAQIFTTEYPDLFLTIDKRARFHDLGTQLEIDTYARALSDYTLFEAENKIAKLGDSSQRALCKNSVQDPDKIHHIQGSHFASRKGEVVYLFECSAKTGKIGTTEACYTMVPLAKGGFVNPENRVLTKQAPQEKCSRYHPLIVQAREGWIALSPLPKQITPPEKKQISHYLTTHEDLSSGGIYTQAELDSWRTHLEMMGYTQALTNQIAYGVCVNNQDCPTITGQETTNYDLANLQAKILQDISILGRMKRFIVEYSAYICSLALMLELIRFCVTLFTISLTLARQGVQGVKLLMFTLCCSKYIKYVKIRDSRVKANEEELNEIGSN